MRHVLKPAAFAAAVVASLTGLRAQAATTAEMQQVKLYGDITVAQDSVQSWGPWEQFEPTAAGNRLPMPTFGSDASNLYRPLAQSTAPAEASAPDSTLEGFATFPTISGQPISLTKVTATVSGTNVEGFGLPSYVGLAFAPHTELGTTSIAPSTTGKLDFAGSQYSNADGSTTVQQYTMDGIDHNAIQAWAFMSYINGEDVPVLGVVGVRTSTVDMNALRAGGYTATYQGSTQTQKYGFNMSVNFGSATFNAAIADSRIGTNVNFAGAVSGSNFASSRVSTSSGTAVTGGLAGFFTGSNTAGVIGNAAYTVGGRTTRDTFVGQRTSLTQLGRSPE